MKIVKLEIRKRETYDSQYPGEIVGLIEMTSENGKVEVKLSNKTVAEIFSLCRNDVKEISLKNAKEAATSCDSAAHEIKMLIENQELED